MALSTTNFNLDYITLSQLHCIPLEMRYNRPTGRGGVGCLSQPPQNLI